MGKSFTFEDAKQQVAEKYGPAQWVKTVCENEPVMSFVKEIAELYARKKSNIAVNEAKDVLGDYLVYNRGESGITLDSILNAISLPYLEEL